MLGTLFSGVEEVFFFTVLALMGESQVQVPTLLLARVVLPLSTAALILVFVLSQISLFFFWLLFATHFSLLKL